MARYKSDNLHQGKCIPLALSDQILPGSLEHTLNELVEKPLNLSICERSVMVTIRPDAWHLTRRCCSLSCTGPIKGWSPAVG